MDGGATVNVGIYFRICSYGEVGVVGLCSQQESSFNYIGRSSYIPQCSSDVYLCIVRMMLILPTYTGKCNGGNVR